MSHRFTDIFLSLFCEKNSDGTKILRLKGNELQQRIGLRVEAEHLPNITAFVKSHPEIIAINLSYNKLFVNAMEELSHIFLEENSIEHLLLLSCSITSEGLQFLADKHLSELKTLRLAGNTMLGAGATPAIMKIIDKSPKLVYLDLGQTGQTLDSAERILMKSTKLEILNLSRIIPDNIYYQVDTTKLADAFAYFFEKTKKIVELHIQYNQLDGHDIETIIYGLKFNKTLRMLDLGYNNIADHGIEHIANWLKTRPNLLGLNVAGNKIKDTGATILSYCMPSSKVRYLNIGCNNITDVGMTNLLNSIKKPYQMRILLIWGNKFGERTNKIIQRMLLSKVLQQEWIDVKIYEVDNILYAAHYPADHYKHKYFEVMDYGCAVPLKIKKNKIETDTDKPRALVNFVHISRFPPILFEDLHHRAQSQAATLSYHRPSVTGTPVNSFNDLPE